MSAGRIDVHHHMVTDFFADAVATNGGDPAGWGMPDWSPELDTEFRAKHQIATSILSLTAPGVGVLKDPQDQAKLARKANEYMCDLREKEPQNYGVFAALPDLINKKEALEELAHCCDVLKVDGVILLTRYGSDNHYLGHADFDDVWAELNRRKAVVFVHPTHAVDTNQIRKGLPQPVIDYPFETTKTAVDMIMSHIPTRFPEVKIILSHAGGTLPFLVSRPASMIPEMDKSWTPEEFLAQAKTFYYDTALSGSDYQLSLLRKFAEPGHILFGSDYPYAGPGMIDWHVNGLDEYGRDSKEFWEETNRKNALKLFPRLVTQDGRA